jgi:hypothetical protein
MYPTKQPTEAEQKVADAIMQHVNGHGLHPEGVVSAMARDHRTLQQHMTRLAVEWFEYLAALEPGQYDLRNEASVQLAKAIVASPEWEERKRLPYV